MSDEERDGTWGRYLDKTGYPYIALDRGGEFVENIVFDERLAAELIDDANRGRALRAERDVENAKTRAAIVALAYRFPHHAEKSETRWMMKMKRKDLI